MSSKIEIHSCPGTLAKGFDTYSSTALKRVFGGKKVYHVLDYDSPNSRPDVIRLFDENRRNISISGVQEKFSVVLDKNKIRLANKEERGTHILKPIPQIGIKREQMPANEHLTMQIARQVYQINTAENALIFFKDGSPGFITKRFDQDSQGNKLAQEDFASLTNRTPQKDGEHYKYLGNYLELFEYMRDYLPIYQVEALKLYKVLIFNYLFSNGDAHLKNFSLLETKMGDLSLSPSYDLLNSRIHIDDNDFALEDGLLPRAINHGKIQRKFFLLAEKAGIKQNLAEAIMTLMITQTTQVKSLITRSYLDEKTKKSYLQQYQKRWNRLMKR
ncbi:MAG: HipA domain-containing protein [Bacteroidota bacterium]